MSHLCSTNPIARTTSKLVEQSSCYYLQISGPKDQLATIFFKDVQGNACHGIKIGREISLQDLQYRFVPANMKKKNYSSRSFAGRLANNHNWISSLISLSIVYSVAASLSKQRLFLSNQSLRQQEMTLVANSSLLSVGMQVLRLHHHSLNLLSACGTYCVKPLSCKIWYQIALAFGHCTIRWSMFSSRWSHGYTSSWTCKSSSA
jgi:hypothetical protein